MNFEFSSTRFGFIARDALFFPEGKAANTLRGALGLTFRRLACEPTCKGAKGCEAGSTCAYARVFEPAAAGGGPSGLADWPRPFVFRARHLNGRRVNAGEPFYFDLNVFMQDPEVLSFFIRSFEVIGCEGLGTRRGKAELDAVSTRHLSLSLAAEGGELDRIQVEFLSPTELKHEGAPAETPDFPVLFARIRDRVSTLCALYGEGPPDIDFAGMLSRARDVRMTRCELRKVDVDRRSSRTGRSHSLGGFVGAAVYEGNLAEFMPYLEIARWTGVGRHTVWGNGELELIRGPGAISGFVQPLAG